MKTHDGRADMTNFEMDLFDTRMMRPTEKEDGDGCCSGRRNHRVVGPACLPITIVALLIITLVFVPLFNDDDLEAADKFLLQNICTKSCDVELTETMPSGLVYKTGPTHPQTYKTWVDLINRAEKYLDIAQMYWELNSTEYPTAAYGREVFEALIRASRDRGVKLRITQSPPTKQFPQTDTQWLEEQGLAKVRSVDMTRLVGAGILHTKFLVSDMQHVYVGSANGDWKSLAEVKEMGIVARNCPCLATDVYRVFAVYWRLGDKDAKVPAQWPISFRTPYNAEKPMEVLYNNKKMSTFVSSSPAGFNPKGREHDLASIVGVIRTANRTVSISVMDYLAQTIYLKSNIFWAPIDDAIRDAAFRGVHVRMLLSRWNHTKPEMDAYARSLLAFNGVLNATKRPTDHGLIEVKHFVVPATKEQARIPFARVNHAKFMVTEDVAYIGTSNWSGDYFINTAGVAVISRKAENGTIVEDLQAVFDRDWESEYASFL
ncbi:unnamed protein product, partial [Mesorhabditis spiculigera]